MTRIIAAAIRHGAGFSIGFRHADIIKRMVEEAGVPRPVTDEQGFIDEAGNFLTREQAAEICVKNGQTATLKNPLTSEDLWDADGKPRDQFQEHLKSAQEIVSQWPAWKRQALGAVEDPKKEGTTLDLAMLLQQIIGHACRQGECELVKEAARRAKAMIPGIIQRQQDALEAAWGIIANAGSGDWKTQSPAWVQAAEKWRDEYIV